MSDQRFNTGNPIGSNSPLDRSDNTRNLDLAVNSPQDTFQDRLGKSRLTWAGMESGFGAGQVSREQRFRTFIASSGYQFAGEYAAGIEITQYNQILRDENGEFWRVSGQVDLPYTTTGEGVPEDDALVPAGDAVLRQDLANPDKGAAMVARGVVAVDSVSDLTEIETPRSDQRYSAASFRGGWSAVSAFRGAIGGGEFSWDPYAEDAEVPGIIVALSSGGPGRFIRVFSGEVDVTWCGAGIGEDDTTAFQIAMDFSAAAQIGEVVVPGGVYNIEAHRNRPTERTRFGVDVPSNTRVTLAADAIINVVPNDRESYAVFRISGSKNVTITGGELVGDKFAHTYFNTQEWGHGIAIWGEVRNVSIINVRIRDMMGDGIYVRAETGRNSVTISDSEIFDCRRHEVTVIAVDGLKVINNRLHKTSANKDGIENVSYGGLNIDVEPNDSSNRVRNVRIRGNDFYCPTNACIRCDTKSSFVQGLRITDNDFSGSWDGVAVNGGYDVQIDKNRIKDMQVAEGWGITLRSVVGVKVSKNEVLNCLRGISVIDGEWAGAITSRRVSISNNDVISPGTASNGIRGTAENLEIKDNTLDGRWDGAAAAISCSSSPGAMVVGNSVVNPLGYGIFINNSPNASIRGNNVTDATRLLWLLSGSTDVKVVSNNFRFDMPTSATYYVRQDGNTSAFYSSNTFRKKVDQEVDMVMQLAATASAKATANDFTGAAGLVVNREIAMGGNFLIDGEYA